jgi:hypothetical protein
MFVIGFNKRVDFIPPLYDKLGTRKPVLIIRKFGLINCHIFQVEIENFGCVHFTENHI